jgi:hypothetical protein
MISCRSASVRGSSNLASVFLFLVLIGLPKLPRTEAILLHWRDSLLYKNEVDSYIHFCCALLDMTSAVDLRIPFANKAFRARQVAMDDISNIWEPLSNFS